MVDAKGRADGLNFDVPSDVIVIVRAPESGERDRYLMAVIDGLRAEVARLRRAHQPSAGTK